MNENEIIFDENGNEITGSGVNEFEDQIRRTEKNGILIAVYFIVTIFISFGFSFYQGFVYPNSDAVLNQIEISNPVNITVTDDPSGTYLYQLDITGALTNNSDTDLQAAYIEIEFFDEAGESLGVYTYSDEDILSGHTMIMDDTLYTDVNFTSYEVGYGFDVYNNTYTFFNLLPVILCTVIFFFVDRECFKYDAKEFKKNFGKNIGQILIGFLIVYAALIISNMILTILGVNETSMNEMAIQNMFTNDAGQLIMLFGLLVVFTPIVEEVVFRKVLYNFVEPRLGRVAAILSSGIIFGLMHVVQYGDFIQAIPYVLMGITFGYIYYSNKKNIWVTIGVHSLNNLVSYVMYLFLILTNGSI